MKPTNFLLKELAEDWKNKRALAFKLVLPMIIILPMMVTDVSASLVSSILTLLVVFLGVFGSAVGLAKLRESGILERLIATPTSKKRMMTEYIAANSLMDILQLSVPLAVVIGLKMPDSAAFISMFIFAVLAANSLGTIVAVVSSSSGEVHLFAMLAVLIVAAASGLFMPIAGLPSEVSSISPFASLASSLSDGGLALTSLLAPIMLSTLILSLAILLSDRFFRIHSA